MQTRLPMGIEDFRRIQTDNFYYVDKTGMIRELLNHMALVNLFTRPRRFGNTLNMRLLKYFFETESWSVEKLPQYIWRDGYSDINVEIRQKDIGMVIELNILKTVPLIRMPWSDETSRDKRYEEALVKNGMSTIYRYGIACYKKQCRVVSEILCERTCPVTVYDKAVNSNPAPGQRVNLSWFNKPIGKMG